MDVKFSAVTAIANRQTAIDLALIGGVQQCLFTAEAVPLGSPPGTPATYCYGSGFMAEAFKALCEANPIFQVKEAVGRSYSAAQMLATCTPALQPWAP
jgi:hypothetical protein